MVKNRKKSYSFAIKTALLSVILSCFSFFSPVTTFAQDDEDEQSSLKKIEQHAQTLKDLIEKYQKAEIDIIKKEKVNIVDTKGVPRDCDVAIFYNNGNQARFTTSGGNFEGNFDHGTELPTRPYSIRLSNCACRVVSTEHSSNLDEINEVVEKIKKVVEGEVEGNAHEKAKEYAEKGVQKIFDKLGYGASAGGFLSGFGYGYELGQPVGDYLTESINQILDTYRERNLESAEHHDFAPLYPGIGHLNPRGRIGNFLGSNPQMTNTWSVVVHCGTRDIPPDRAVWHKVKDPIRTPPPPRTYAPDTSDDERRIAQEREEQRRWEQEKRRREAEARRTQEEARKRYEAEQRRIRQKALEIMKTCPICDPIRQHIATVTKRFSETEQQIPELQNAVADAQKALDDANKKVHEAEQKLSDFRNPESWVESNGRRITSTDLEVQKELSRKNWRRYMNGEQNAEETMENWQNQSNPERHEQAKQRAEERLENAVEEAKEVAQEAQQNLEETNKKLSEAEQLLRQLDNRKSELEKLLEDCLKKCRVQAEEIARGEITTYAELMEIEHLNDPVPAKQPETEPEPTETPEEFSLDPDPFEVGNDGAGTTTLRTHPDFMWFPTDRKGVNETGEQVDFSNVKMVYDLLIEEVDEGGQESAETQKESTPPSDEITEKDPATDSAPETSQIQDDTPDALLNEPIQSETATGWDIFGSSIRVGAKADWATRSSFKDAVCAQDGLVDCTVDGLTPVLVLFGETSLFDWNLTEQGIGIIPISAGASLTLSQVDFDQNYAYGTASPLSYDISGQTGILAFDTYLRGQRAFKPVLSLPGRPIFSPYAKIGMSNIWNCTDFEFMSEDETFEYHREHHGVHFMGGLGTDVNFGGAWGARINMDYTAGGADANLRFGAGVTYTFGDR